MKKHQPALRALSFTFLSTASVLSVFTLGAPLAQAANTLRCSLTEAAPEGATSGDNFALDCLQNKTNRRFSVRFEGGASQLSLEQGQIDGFRVFCPLVNNDRLAGNYYAVRIETEVPSIELAVMVSQRLGICAIAGLKPLTPGTAVSVDQVRIEETTS